MDKILVVFSMNGCGHCEHLKSLLKENEISFIDRDIHKHNDEYKIFTEKTGSEFVPAFMVIENILGKTKTEAFVPDKNFKTIEEGFELIKQLINWQIIYHLLKKG